MALYAPIGLVLLPVVWLLLIIAGFAVIYWAIHEETLGESLVLSGSSATTLGFLRPEPRLGDRAHRHRGRDRARRRGADDLLPADDLRRLPRREALVGDARGARRPAARPGKLFRRYETHRAARATSSDDLFPEWEQWFVDIEESAHQPTGAGVLPLAAPRTVVDQRRRAACSTPPRCGPRWWTSRGTRGPTS